MVMTITQLLALLFGLFMLFMTWRFYRRRRLSWVEFALWFTLWCGLVVAILLFNTIARFSQDVLQVEPFDLFVLVAILVLFIIAFAFHGQLKVQQKKMLEVTEELAKRELDDAKAHKHPQH